MLFCFQGGLKNAFTNSEGHFSLLYFCQGGFFRSKMDLERSKKNPGGLHDLLEISGGPIIIT